MFIATKYLFQISHLPQFNISLTLAMHRKLQKLGLSTFGFENTDI